MVSKSKPPTPARLSAISTSLLTSILELSQQNSLDLPVNPSITSNIIKNLISLRDGLIQLGVDDQDEILIGLRNQYGRIIGLVKGLGGMEQELEGLDLQLPMHSNPPSSQEPLIEVDDQTSSPSNLKQTTQRLSSTSPSRENSSSERIETTQTAPSDIVIQIPSCTRSRKAIQEDEELMRSENEQVQRIQQVLLDDQDRTLDELSNAISRQRDLSLHISSELEVQENLLDELDQNMDFTSNRLTRANRRMDGLFQKIAKDGACWTIFGLVAVLLFLIVLLK